MSTGDRQIGSCSFRFVFPKRSNPDRGQETSSKQQATRSNEKGNSRSKSIPNVIFFLNQTFLTVYVFKANSRTGSAILFTRARKCLNKQKSPWHTRKNTHTQIQIWKFAICTWLPLFSRQESNLNELLSLARFKSPIRLQPTIYNLAQAIILDCKLQITNCNLLLAAVTVAVSLDTQLWLFPQLACPPPPTNKALRGPIRLARQWAFVRDTDTPSLAGLKQNHTKSSS